MPTFRVSLNRITPLPVAAGGWRIACAIAGDPLPKSAQVLLVVGGMSNALDVSRMPLNGLVDATNLPDLLALVARANAWSREIDVWVVLKSAGAMLAWSSPQKLRCPVPPLKTRLTLASVAAEQPALTYPGNGHGRILHEVGGRHYFVHGSHFETDPGMRGFDCTTFPMALFDCRVNMAGKYGTALAEALGAQRCRMEAVKEPAVKRFFAGPGSIGVYFMWSAGHVVIAKNAVLHEFTLGGFRRSAAESWRGYKRAPRSLWWIRRLTQSC